MNCQDSYKSLVEAIGAEQVVMNTDALVAAPFGPFRLIIKAVGCSVLTQSLNMIALEGI